MSTSFHLRVVLVAVAFTIAGTTILALTWMAADIAATFPEYSWLRVPYSVGAVVVAINLETLLYIVWRSLHTVGSGAADIRVSRHHVKVALGTSISIALTCALLIGTTRGFTGQLNPGVTLILILGIIMACGLIATVRRLDSARILKERQVASVRADRPAG